MGIANLTQANYSQKHTDNLKKTCNKNFKCKCSQAVNKCGYLEKGMTIWNEAYMKMLNIDSLPQKKCHRNVRS